MSQNTPPKVDQPSQGGHQQVPVADRLRSGPIARSSGKEPGTDTLNRGDHRDQEGWSPRTPR